MTQPWLPDIPEDAQGGSATAFKARLQSLSIQGGEPVTIPTRGVTAIVGGNNVGKSTVLRDIRDRLSLQRGQSLTGFRLVDSLSLFREGTQADLIAWLGTHADYINTRNTSGFRKGESGTVTPGKAIEAWTRQNYDRLGQLFGFLVFYADATGRLNLAKRAEHRGDIADPPTHPLHYLQDSPDLLTEIQGISEHIFRRQLTLDRLSGKISLRVGHVSIATPPVDAVTEEYKNALTALPHLEDQGDGMKSLLGLLLSLVTATHEVVLVDEPEAFLHPPQARALGTELARIAQERDLQVVLATHDRNILTGLLERQGVDVSVARLTRESDETTAHQLDPDGLRSIWAQPVLKYSNALDGLFHRLVVIAEGDRDSRFYNAALDSAYEHGLVEINPAEILFLPSGGKTGMPKLAEALVTLRVQVVLTPDLDILSDEGLVRNCVEALGGSWDEVGDIYQRATSGFGGSREQATCGDVLTAVNATLQGREQETFDRNIRQELQAQMRVTENPWRALQRYGDRAFTGEAAAAASSLFDHLDDIGIVLVRVGELEGFGRDLGVSKGPAWLRAALDERVYEHQLAVEHVCRVVHGRT